MYCRRSSPAAATKGPPPVVTPAATPSPAVTPIRGDAATPDVTVILLLAPPMLERALHALLLHQRPERVAATTTLDRQRQVATVTAIVPTSSSHVSSSFISRPLANVPANAWIVANQQKLRIRRSPSPTMRQPHRRSMHRFFLFIFPV